jgi:O-antigen ligase
MTNSGNQSVNRLSRLKLPDPRQVNAWFVGYAATVPAIAGSLLTFMIFASTLWEVLNNVCRRYDFRWPVRSIPFIAAGLFCLLAFVLTGLVTSDPGELFAKLRPMLALLAPPLMIARFRAFDPAQTFSMLLQYAPLGSAAGLVSFYVSGGDAGGAGNQNVFGVAMAVLGALSLAGALSDDKRARLLGFGGYLVAVFAVVVSSTRTMVPPVLLIGVAALVLRSRLDRRWLLGAAALLIALVVALVPAMVVQVSSAINDVTMMETSSAVTPVGARIAMWMAAGKAIMAQPWFGYGLPDRMDVVISLNKTMIALPHYSHVHNAYLDSLLAGGIPALAGLLTLLLAPLWMLSGGQENRQRDFVILAIVFTFAIRGLAGNILTHDLIIMLYLFPLIVAAAADPRPVEKVLWRVRSHGSR